MAVEPFVLDGNVPSLGAINSYTGSGEQFFEGATEKLQLDLLYCFYGRITPLKCRLHVCLHTITPWIPDSAQNRRPRAVARVFSGLIESI